MTTVPETATSDWAVADLLDIHDQEDHLYELVEGVLVEKTRDVQETLLAVLLARLG